MTSNITIPSDEDSRTTLNGENLLYRRDMWLLSIAAFIAMMLSKAGTLLPGMSIDDYSFAFVSHTTSTAHNFIAQGRGLNALLFGAVHALNTSFADVDGFSFFLASAMISLAIAGSIALMKYERKNQAHHYAAAIFAGTHPYLTSYFLFRMTLVSQAFLFAALFAAIWLIAVNRSFWRQVACVLLLAACSHISQIILILFAISGGGWALAQFCYERKRGVDFSHATRGIISFVAVIGLATLLYFLSSAIARSVLHVTATSVYSPQLHGGIFGTTRTAFRLAYEVLFVDESILPSWLKLWIFLAIAGAVISCSVRDLTQGVSCLVLLICGLLVTVSTMALSWGYLVPRTFSPIGLCLALVFCLACDGAHIRKSRGLVAVMVLPIVSFCFIGASLFHQQLMLTHWDQRTAAAIYERVTEQTSESTPIRIVASWPIHKQPFSYNGPGINESAFLDGWAYPGLFAVATGARLDVAAGDRSMCNGVPAWPNPGSMKRLEDGSMLVCMVR